MSTADIPGPLPAPCGLLAHEDGSGFEDCWTADKVRAYGEQERAAKREWCADLCDRAAAAAWIAWDATADPADQGRALEAEALAAEIRGPNVRAKLPAAVR